MMEQLVRRVARYASFIAASLMLATAPAGAASPLLDDTVDFTGTFIFLGANVPGLVIAVVRNGESVVHGYGETTKGNGKPPDGDTLMRVGSITKVFTGATLASMVADGKVGFTDRLQDKLGWNVAIPELDHKPIRLIDLHVRLAARTGHEIHRQGHDHRDGHQGGLHRLAQAGRATISSRHRHVLLELRLRPVGAGAR
jgi:hypothetical protein